jgi:predicted ribosome quality control (RQC) complex YloA/Tae2 family protein
MREAGIPVGLAARGARRATLEAGAPRPRLEGVRLFRTADGLSAMIGKSARDNDRLTFRLAGPEDFWFHALRVTGAHVVVRNEERATAPPPRSLEEAAAAAAWYSEARANEGVDVQWTRRKYVRRVRGGAPGKVIVKRFATLRVRPRAPAGGEGAP